MPRPQIQTWLHSLQPPLSLRPTQAASTARPQTGLKACPRAVKHSLPFLASKATLYGLLTSANLLSPGNNLSNDLDNLLSLVGNLSNNSPSNNQVLLVGNQVLLVGNLDKVVSRAICLVALSRWHNSLDRVLNRTILLVILSRWDSSPGLLHRDHRQTFRQPCIPRFKT